MFNIGFAELILVLLIAFLIVGPKDLPKVARFLGKCVKWVRGIISELKAESGWDDMMRETSDIRKDVDEAMKQMDITRELREARQELNQSVKEAERGTFGKTRENAAPKQTEPKSAAGSGQSASEPEPQETEKTEEPEPEGNMSLAPGSWKEYKRSQGGNET